MHHFRMMHLQRLFVFPSVPSPSGILPVKLFMSRNTSKSAGVFTMLVAIEPDSVLLLAMTYSG